MEDMKLIKEIYFAGGCFWGTEKVFQLLNGVLDTTVGYANGLVSDPTYEMVKTGETGHRETVKVTYNNDVVSLETLLEAYFLCVDPTVKNRQGGDIGTQYQTGVYYTDEESGAIIEKVFCEKRKHFEAFYIELLPLKCFYTAEEYHQDYLIKNPEGYCHISRESYDAVKTLNQFATAHC